MFVGFGILAFPGIQDISRSLVNHLDLPLLSQLLGILYRATNLLTNIVEAVAVDFEFSNYFRIVLEWWVLMSPGSGADV